MSKASRRKSNTEQHVRIYKHEWTSLAWRTLDPDARVLLIELRALYRPSESNIVFLSVRQAMARCNIGQRRATAAFAALVVRGWIAVHEQGAFTRKVRHATSYRLLNEPNASPGALPRKDFMRWKPPDDEKTR